MAQETPSPGNAAGLPLPDFSVTYLSLVGVGAALGTGARVFLELLPAPAGLTFINMPFYVWLANLIGAFGLGIFIGMQAARRSTHAAVLFWTTGFFGAFTTYSALGALMASHGNFFGATAGKQNMANLRETAAMVILGLVVAYLGMKVGKTVFKAPPTADITEVEK